MPDDLTGEQVAPQATPQAALPAGAITPATVGTNIAQGVEQQGMIALRTGFDAKRMAAEQQEKTDQVASQAGVNAATSWTMNHLTGKDGLLWQQKGLNAPQAAQDFQEQQSKQIGQIREQLQNPEQQRRFDVAMQEHQGRTQLQLNDWSHRQAQQFDDQTTEATLRLHQDAALTAGATTDNSAQISDAVNNHLAMGGLAIIDAERRAGHVDGNNTLDAVAQQRLQEWTSQTTLKVMQGMAASGSDQHLQAFYDEHKGDLAGDDIKSGTELLKTTVGNADAQRTTMGIALGPDGKLIPQADAFEKALKVPPEQQGQVLERLGKLYSENEAATKAQDLTARNRLYGIQSQSPSGFLDPQVQAGLVGLSPESQEWLRSADHRQQKGDLETDPRLMANLLTRAGSADPQVRQQWAKEDPYQMLPFMAKADWSRLYGEDGKGGIRAAVLSGDVKNPQLAGVLTHEQVISEGLQSLYGQKFDATKHEAQANDLREAYMQQVQQQEGVTGKPVDAVAGRKIMQDMLIRQVSVDGSLTPAAEVKPGDVGKISGADLSKLPQQQQDLVTRQVHDSIRAKGLDPNTVSPAFTAQITAQSMVISEAMKRGDTATAQEALAQMNESLRQERLLANDREAGAATKAQVRQARAEAAQRFFASRANAPRTNARGQPVGGAGGTPPSQGP
jgi:hypothetical protein